MLFLKHAAAKRGRREIIYAVASLALGTSQWAGAVTALRISGAPALSIEAAHYYAFDPSAQGPAGSKLSFAVSNKPSWAQFDATTGRLFGTPPPANAGSYPNIVISVSDGSQRASLAPFAVKVLPLANNPPQISGTPAASVTAPSAYAFQPTAKDPNGFRIGFGIWNKPAWLTFDSTTGRLSGTAGTANVGVYPNIVITVYDGYFKASLPAFGITVKAAVASAPPPVPTPTTATVSWTPPAQNSNGTPLTNLAGYHVYYGTTQSNLNQSVTLANPGLTRYVIENLTPATWYFAITAYNSAGVESPLSGVDSLTLR
jgi:hypothetical protein